VGIHRVILEGLSPLVGARVVIGGDEAHHAARVKRCAVGDVVELLNGRGTRGTTLIRDIRKSRQGEWELELEITSIATEERVAPRLEVLAPAAKGERLEDMIDGLSQVGADAYRPLLTKRTVVDPREGKMNRLRRVAAESLKQCGRGWLLEIGDAIGFADAIKPQPGTLLLAADASGGTMPTAAVAKAERVVLLVGPEGGFSDEEFTQLAAAGVTLFRSAPHVLRVETAAVVGAAMIRSLPSSRSRGEELRVNRYSSP
jgi:16S rRNA (uracil1498-N3)-methyltransferase